jgi:autotransporter-associated beta strand protein
MKTRLTFTPLSSPIVLLFSALVGLIIFSAQSLRAQDVWNGLGGDNKWSTGGNWVGGVAPVSGQALEFMGSTQPNTNNDILPNQSYSSITFDSNAAAFTLAGETIGMNSGGIINNSTNLQTLSFNIPDPAFPEFQGILVQQDQTWNAAAGDLLISANVQANLGMPTVILTIDGAFHTTISGVIADNPDITNALVLVKNGSGTLTLSGTNTYSGGTTINGGVLEISDDTNLGAAAGTVTMDNNAVLRTLASITFNASRNFIINAGGGTIDLNNNNSTLNGMISGTGVFTVTDTPGFGTLTLTGDNSGLTGGMAVTNDATVSVSADNNLGAAAALLVLDDGIVETTASFTSGRQVNLTATSFDGSGTFIVDSGVTTTLTGQIFGNGQLVKQGPGDLLLTSNNVYSGGTELDSGGLYSDVSPGDATNHAFGTGTIDIFGGTLGTHVDGEVVSNALTVHGDFSTAPPINGNLFLNGDVTLLGTFTVTAQNDGSGTHFGGAIGDGGNNFGLNLADAASGGAVGFNRFFFEGATPNTYTGLTEIMDNADLHLAKSDGVTAIAGDVQIDANGAMASDANEQIADTSTVTVNSTGLLTASNPAGWLLQGHTETIGSLFGTGTVALDDQAGGSAGTLIIGAGNFSGVIEDSGQGNGELRKVGPGTLILSGINTYTSPTNINGGILQVDGSIASTLTTVNPGGTLAGIGTIGGDVINSGIVSPGDGPSMAATLTITGNYTQNSNGTLHSEIGGLNSGVNSDLLHINGTAALDGTLEVVRINNFSPLPNDRVTILQADGGRGGSMFATVTPIGWNGLIQPMADYTDPLTVDIVFQLSATFESQGLTRNQISVGENIDDSVGDSRADALIAFLGSELPANLPHDFDLIAPEELASIYEIGFSQAVVTNMNLQHRMDDIRAGSTGFCSNGYQAQTTGGYSKESDGKVGIDKNPTPAFVPSPENRWGIFATGSGDFVNVGDHDTNAHGYDITTGGVTVGVDYRVCDHFAIGIDGSYNGSTADLVDRGRVEVDGGKAGAYATVFGYKILGSTIHIDGAVSGGWNSYDTNRTGLEDLPVRGSTNGSEINAMLAYGGDWHFGCLLIGTWSSLQYTNVQIDSFTETGSLAPLQIQDQNEDSFRTSTGLRVAYDFKSGNAIIRPEVRGAWQHEYGDRAYPIDASLASGAGDVFRVWGPAIGRDSALVDAGIAVQWSNRFSTYIYYDGVLGRSNYDNNGVSGGLRISF